MQKVEIITKIIRKELTKMERLEYENYKGCKDVITIDLHNDYTVIAIKSWNPDEQKYEKGIAYNGEVICELYLVYYFRLELLKKVSTNGI